MKRTKILYVITKDDVGGAQKYVKDLAENLDKERFEMEIIAGGKSGARFLSNVFKPYFLFINDWLALIELFFVFKKEKPDVIHLNSSKAGVIGSLAAWLYKVQCQMFNVKCSPPKVVFTAHGWVFNPDNDLSWARREFYILLHKLAARFQDRIINVSEYDRKLAISRKIAPPEKLITARNGLDIKRALFLDKTAARKKLSTLLVKPHTLNPNDIWVGSIGRLVKEKNYETFVKAAALVKNPNVKFFIIGDGYEKKKLLSLINNLNLRDKFFIIGNLAPAAPYLKAFDIFALSSIKEGLPYTLLEAMSANLPIIATRVGGITEILEPANGPKTGLVMPPKEPEELARAINHLLEDRQKAQEFATNAQLFFKNELGIEKMLEKTVALYIDRTQHIL